MCEEMRCPFCRKLLRKVGEHWEYVPENVASVDATYPPYPDYPTITPLTTTLPEPHKVVWEQDVRNYHTWRT